MSALQGPARLGFDPRLKYIPLKDGDETMAKAELRMNLINYKRVPGGESEDRGFWVQAEVWGEQAELAAKHLKKGDKIYVIGDFYGSNWESEEGPQTRPVMTIRRISLDIRDLQQFQFKPRRSNSESGEPDEQSEAQEAAEHTA